MRTSAISAEQRKVVHIHRLRRHWQRSRTMLVDMEMPPSTGPGIVRLRTDLISNGLSDRELRAGVRTGSVSRVDRGAYVPGADAPKTPLARHRHRIEASAQRSPHLVIGYTSAAVWHRMALSGLSLERVHQIRDGVGGGSRTTRRHVHSGSLRPDDVVTVDGIRVTSPARTLVDLARTVPFQPAVIAADDALYRKLVTPGDLHAALQRAAHLSHAGAARRALQFADGRAESVGESRTRVVMRSCGLPEPELQIEVRDQGEFVARVDLGYPDLAVVVEFDGETKYGKLLAPGMTPTEAVVREKRREDELRRLGLVVVRFTWHELADRRLVHSRVLRAMKQGRRMIELGALTGTLVPSSPIRIPR